MCKFETHFGRWYLEYPSQYCPGINGKVWWQINIHSGKGLVPSAGQTTSYYLHDNVIKWKYFSRYWPYVRGIHRSPVNSPHKGQWRGALMFSFICVRINSWVNNREVGDLRRYRAHYDVSVMEPVLDKIPAPYGVTRRELKSFLDCCIPTITWYP